MNPIKQYIEELCEATLYHGTNALDIVECEEGICLAYNSKIAKEYSLEKYVGKSISNPKAMDNGEFVYSVDVADGISIAMANDVLRMAKDFQYRNHDVALVLSTYSRQLGLLYRLCDNGYFREYMREQGFDAVQFMDFSPASDSRHKTLRILNPSIVKVKHKKQIKR